MTSLSGTAWRQIEHLVDKAAEAENGFDMVLAELDKTFKYDDQVEMPRAFDKFFYGCNRRDGQTLINYVADHREALMEVESMPDRVAGWILLRRSGLTTQQKQMVQARASDFKQTSVVEALYFLFGQDYKSKAADGRQWKKSYGNRWGARQQGYVAEEFYDDGEDWDEDAYWEQDEDQDEYEMENGGDEDEEAYYAYPEDEDIHEEAQADLEHQYEEAHATYLHARKHLSQLKASRGY